MPARRYFGIQIELDSDAATDQLNAPSLPKLKLFRDNRAIAVGLRSRFPTAVNFLPSHRTESMDRTGTHLRNRSLDDSFLRSKRPPSVRLSVETFPGRRSRARKLPRR
jgi:hypothetical protein